MDTRTPLTTRPAMNDLPIGPGGETFGQLRSAVVGAREAYGRCPCDHHADAWQGAQDALLAAYELVGLPYEAP